MLLRNNIFSFSVTIENIQRNELNEFLIDYSHRNTDFAYAFRTRFGKDELNFAEELSRMHFYIDEAIENAFINLHHIGFPGLSRESFFYAAMPNPSLGDVAMSNYATRRRNIKQYERNMHIYPNLSFLNIHYFPGIIIVCRSTSEVII